MSRVVKSSSLDLDRNKFDSESTVDWLIDFGQVK